MQQNSNKNRKNTTRDSSHNAAKHTYGTGGKPSERSDSPKYNKGGNYSKCSGKSFTRRQNGEKDGVTADVTVRRTYNGGGYGYKKKNYGRYQYQAGQDILHRRSERNRQEHHHV